MTTAKVAISADFLTAFAHLPRQVQGKVTEFVNKFRNDPASPEIHYERDLSSDSVSWGRRPAALSETFKCLGEDYLFFWGSFICGFFCGFFLVWGSGKCYNLTFIRYLHYSDTL